MNLVNQLQLFAETLLNLDTRKKLALIAILGSLAIAFVGITMVARTPSNTTLYTGLEREDLNRMSRVLSENGIGFDVDNDKGTISVSPPQLHTARLILAENGLPSAEKTGYALFDGVNTLGLTSFMQDVTNKRAIEGELAHTIQMIRGIHSARVHLVIPRGRSLRKKTDETASASVVLKTFGTIPEKTTLAIRHMVAAAVVGLESNNVAVIGADGSLLHGLGTQMTGGSSNLIELENTYSHDMQSKITAAIGPHLGIDNFRVTVTAKLNGDVRRVDETVFDPESRIERSVQVVKEVGNSENKASSQETSIIQNIPDEEGGATGGQSTTENSEKREELTNYEINKKNISIVSDGYQVEKLAVSMIVNRQRIDAVLGSNNTEEAVQSKVAELENMIKASIGYSEERGDVVAVTLVEFLPGELANVGEASTSASSIIFMYLGSIIESVGLIVGMLILSLLGIRPLISFLGKERNTEGEPAPVLAEGESPEALPDESGQPVAQPMEMGAAAQLEDQSSSDVDLSSIEERENRLREQLSEMVTLNSERAAYVIRQWLDEKHGQAT